MTDQHASASDLFWKFRERVRAERPRKVRASALVALPAAAGLLATTVMPAYAFDSETQAVPTIRLTIPFGPATKAGEKKIGFGFQRTIGAEAAYFDRYEVGGAYFSGVQPDLFSVGWSGEGLESLGFGGVNALVKETRLNADGSQDTTFGIRTDYLVMGLVGTAVIGGVVYAATKDDDDGNSCTPGSPGCGGSGGI
tara:strand:- start:13249 stop:13836 length:588 start_codon:yes stop_codon:yes gene_type:complete